jgi:uncharacterized damage-inducible protein DinB
MITPEYIEVMVGYNHWQNGNLYSMADRLSDAQRKEPRGAFFGSIHATLNHLLWADQLWMHRFAGTARPHAAGVTESVAMYREWDELKRARDAFDKGISGWAEGVTAEWLSGNLTWHSASFKRDVTKPRWVLVTHFFNHQTHHRGQVHCLLTQCNLRPSDTDLSVMGVA